MNCRPFLVVFRAVTIEKFELLDDLEREMAWSFENRKNFHLLNVYFTMSQVKNFIHSLNAVFAVKTDFILIFIKQNLILISLDF